MEAAQQLSNLVMYLSPNTSSGLTENPIVSVTMTLIEQFGVDIPELCVEVKGKR